MPQLATKPIDQQSLDSPGNMLFSVAAGLIWNDRAIFPLLLLVSSCAMIYGGFSTNVDSSVWVTSRIIERLLQLLVLFGIGRRTIRSLSTTPNGPPGVSSAFWIVSSGLAVWFLLFIPIDLFSAIPSQRIQSIIALLLIPIMVLLYLYFLYFFPFFLPLKRVGQALSIAREYTRKDKWLPIKTTLAPCAIMYIFQGIVLIPFPDGREPLSSLIADCFSGLYWVLSCYLGIAAGIVYLPDKLWHESGLDPYRQSRLTTLSIRCPSVLARIFKPRQAASLIVFACLIWAANIIRASEMLPSPHITLEKLWIKDREVHLSLSLNDEKYKFRGFHPAQFRLAGAEKRILADRAQAFIPPSKEDVSIFFPQGMTDTKLELVFTSDRDEKDLIQLEDLYLWYGGARLILLDPKS